jgi:hypothetical protein
MNKILPAINLLGLVGVIAINALANILPINDITTGEVSAQYENYFTPAGIIFAIWSMIYLSLLAFVIYQFFPNSRDRNTGITNKLGSLFLINCAANISWMFAWHYSVFELTLLFMLLLLVTLVRINLNIEENSWWVRFPFQLYLGWICVATIANMAVYLTYLGWKGEMYTGIIMMTIAAALALFLTLKKYWIWSSLAIAWGLFGIYKKQMVLNPGSVIQWMAIILVLILLIVVLGKLFLRRAPMKEK